MNKIKGWSAVILASLAVGLSTLLPEWLQKDIAWAAGIFLLTWGAFEAGRLVEREVTGTKIYRFKNKNGQGDHA